MREERIVLLRKKRESLFLEKRNADSWEGEGAGDCVDIAVDDCAAVESGAERGNGVPDFCMSFAEVAVQLVSAG